MYRSHVLVCGGTGCTSSGSPENYRSIKGQKLIKPDLKMKLQLFRPAAMDLCALGPIMIVYPEATFYSMVQVK